MSDYHSMTNEELDRAAGEMLDGIYLGFDGWHPTSPASNQAERYLFPKLIEKGLKIRMFFQLDDFSAEIEQLQEVENGPDYWDEWVTIGYGRKHNPDQINRTKVIAWLKAMEKLDEK